MSAASPLVVLRTPLLPLDILKGWAALVDRPPDAATSAERLTRSADLLRASYRTLLADPIVREAIFVASPDFHAAVDDWLRSPGSAATRDIERALTRYLTRMASRPTPFGLFGSVSAGRVGVTTALDVAPHTAVHRHTRLDIDYLTQVVEALTADPAIRAHLRYRPADTVCRMAGAWRYLETRVSKAGRTHHLVSVEDNDAVSAALAAARAGATPAQLEAAVRALGLDGADDFVHALIDSRIVIPDLACPVTGTSPATAIAARLATIPPAAAAAAALQHAIDALRGIDATEGVAAGPEPYAEVRRALGALYASATPAQLFQVDMARPTGATLGPAAMALIRRAGEVLYDLCPPAPEDAELDRVKEAWTERFGERVVPLLEALDDEHGVGSTMGTGSRDASPLIRGLDVPKAKSSPLPWGDRERCLLSLVVHAAQRGSLEVELTADIVQTPRPTPAAQPPHAFAVNAALVSRPGGELEVLVHSTTGPSSVRLQGRFCHLDAELDEGVRRLVASEEALEPDAVHAEIVHLPEGRAGNVILRPVLRSYEIPAMGVSGAGESRQLPLSDLTLQLAGGTFTLRSTRLGMRVIPRMTTAHNFSRFGVGAYRLLCLLQAEGEGTGVAWSWGPLATSPFLPRVRVGDVVVSRATWRLDMHEIAALQRPGVEQRWSAVQQLRTARNMPRWIVLGDGDNELVVDLENVLAVDSLIQLLKGREDARFIEWYPGPDGSVARGPEGTYAAELIVPFVGEPERQERHPAPAVRRRARARRPSQPRTFLPGSTWVFAKAYGGTASADHLLLETIGPLSQSLEKQGAITRWFFIRYADPAEHIRWRMDVAPRASVAAVRRQMERALASAVEGQRVWRIAFDTYEREVERYGGSDATVLAERLFHADSVAAIEVLQALQGLEESDDRWLAVAMSIDRLMTDLGLNLTMKAQMMREARERFGVEFRVNAEFRRALAARFRTVATTLDRVLEDRPERGSVLLAVASILARRSRRMRRTCAALERLAATGASTLSVPTLAFSYIHMTVNRLVRSEARMHELVLYDFLAQTYARRLSRARATSSELR